MQIEDAQMMLRVGIAAVDAVAENRHIGHGGLAAGLRHDQQFMHGAEKSVDHDFGLIGDRIEEQNFRSHLVDRDHAVFYVGHR